MTAPAVSVTVQERLLQAELDKVRQELLAALQSEATAVRLMRDAAKRAQAAERHAERDRTRLEAETANRVKAQHRLSLAAAALAEITHLYPHLTVQVGRVRDRVWEVTG